MMDSTSGITGITPPETLTEVIVEVHYCRVPEDTYNYYAFDLEERRSNVRARVAIDTVCTLLQLSFYPLTAHYYLRHDEAKRRAMGPIYREGWNKLGVCGEEVEAIRDYLIEEEYQPFSLTEVPPPLKAFVIRAACPIEWYTALGKNDPELTKLVRIWTHEVSDKTADLIDIDPYSAEYYED